MRPRVHPRAEALDDDEATAAAGAGRRWWLVVAWLWVGLIRGNWGEQVPDPGDVDGPRAAGEQAVVADAVEAVAVAGMRPQAQARPDPARGRCRGAGRDPCPEPRR